MAAGGLEEGRQCSDPDSENHQSCEVRKNIVNYWGGEENSSKRTSVPVLMLPPE